MRKITKSDLTNITGIPIEGYLVEAARIKKDSHTDNGHYGIILARNPKNEYVTWQFHFREDESISVYWGHYMTDYKAAVRDFNTRDMVLPLQKFTVTITETLKMAIMVEAANTQEATQIVSDGWHSSKYILDADDFSGVEFEAVLVVDKLEEN